jgi:hypothetical protein
LTCLLLIERTTSPASADRFEKLWALLGEGIIESVWFYGYGEPETIQATLDVLPSVFTALGIGCARYLKVAAQFAICISAFSRLILQPLVLQLVHPLLPAPENPATIPFQLSSVRALAVLVEECAPRMPSWKGTILDGVCRCWVNLVESGADNTGKSPCYLPYELITLMQTEQTCAR